MFVGMGSVLVTLWVFWLLGLFVVALVRWLPRWCIVAAVWAAVVLFYLVHSVNGYISDIAKYSREVEPKRQK